MLLEHGGTDGNAEGLVIPNRWAILAVFFFARLIMAFPFSRLAPFLH
jgi:hypothetical protein